MFGYGEPFGDAWGNHGGRRSQKGIEPATSIYWQTLLDLHVGLSFIACYGSDLKVALDGEIPALNPTGGKATVAEKNAAATKPKSPKEKDPAMKEEFFQAFSFGARYAGYHASPAISPGAWIALRQVSKTDDRKNLGDVESNDCTFLMKRLPDQSRATTHIGPAKSRFYGYSRLLPKGEKMRLVFDELFAKSMQPNEGTINLTYFDKGSGAFVLNAGGKDFPLTLQNTDQWKTIALSADGVNWQTMRDGAHITIQSPSDDLILHMIEVQRK